MPIPPVEGCCSSVKIAERSTARLWAQDRMAAVPRSPASRSQVARVWFSIHGNRFGVGCQAGHDDGGRSTRRDFGFQPQPSVILNETMTGPLGVGDISKMPIRH